LYEAGPPSLILSEVEGRRGNEGEVFAGKAGRREWERTENTQ